ncbi:hypothetical protein K456DRAFT_1947320 [Colletotrichum gloeosporioides 23]|nr:hypothetical protein K456DRAFT_1947320 [Colletotrichum gloeosporioides 23]
MIGKRYLWIDSLCINQDDLTDWRLELEKMYGVFKNACCTIAATSARHSDEEFLNGPIEVPDLKPGSGDVGDFRQAFQNAVEHSVLNKRAWVLQERTLSQRILHFTNNQLFMECGGGVCWGLFGYLVNGKFSFRSDLTFLERLRYCY